MDVIEEFAVITDDAWENIRKAQDEYSMFGTSMIIVTVNGTDHKPLLDIKHIPIRKQLSVLGSVNEETPHEWRKILYNS